MPMEKMLSSDLTVLDYLFFLVIWLPKTISDLSFLLLVYGNIKFSVHIILKCCLQNFF